MKQRSNYIMLAAAVLALFVVFYSGIHLINYRKNINVEETRVKGILAPWQYDKEAEKQPAAGAEQFSGDELKRVFIDIVDAEVIVERWDSSEFRIEYDMTSIDQEFHEDVYARIYQDSETLSVKTQIRPNSNYKGNMMYHVYIPEPLSLAVIGASSNIELVNIAEKTRVSAESISGTISLQGSSSADLSTVSGDINFAVYSGGRIKARSSSGSIEALLQESDASEGQLDGSMELSTDRGSISLDLPDDIEADFDIHSENGVVDTEFSDFTLKEDIKNHFIGTRGEGTYNLKISTQSGRINIF
ncbi:MAG: DUF4097 domain-containing protein [Spirochaetia bacterium]|nr:DUF4097 domain-containing protein [Spirochaetia bacterium]MCF7952928.1 DUF4097 domain-containing protein [Spirochaetales bacterium]